VGSGSATESYTLVEDAGVAGALAEDEVAVAVVGSVSIQVKDDCSSGQRFAEDSFDQ
jgi:hypothetical protein